MIAPAQYQVDLHVEFDAESDCDVITEFLADLLDGTPSSGDPMPPGFEVWIEGCTRIEYDQ